MADEIDKKAQELADKLGKASEGLNKPFKGLVDNLAEVNKEIAISAADIRKDTRDTFSGFLSKKKLAKAMEDFDKTEFEKNKAKSTASTDARDKLLKEEQAEINRNKTLNEMKRKAASKQFSIDNNITNGIEDRLQKQKEIDEIQQEIDAKETEIKKFRADRIEKANKDIEEAEEERIKLEEQFSEDMKKASSSERFDDFSGAIKDLSGGLLDIGGMLDDVTKFGNNLKTIGTEFKNFGNFLGDKLGNPVDKLKDLFWGLVASAGAFFTTMKTSASEKMSAVGEKFTAVKDSVTSKVSNVKDKVGEKGGAVKDMFSEKAKLFQGKMADLGNTMKDGAKTMGGKGLKAIKMAPKMLMKGATRFVTLLARIPAMLAAIPAILASPFVLIGAAVLLLAVGLVLVWMKFKDSIMEKFEAMKTKVTEVVTNIVDGFLDVWQRVKNWFSDKVFGIRSFLGLTSEEEEAEKAKQDAIKEKEKEKERLKEEQKEIAMQAKEAEIDAQLKAEYGEDALNWGWGRGDKEAKEMKKQMMEQAEADIDQDMAMDDISSEGLLQERKESEQDYFNVQDVIDARQKEVENKVKFSNLKINGEDATEEQKREFYQEQADKGQLDGRLGGGLERFEGTKGVTTEELLERQASEVLDINRAQKELDTREDYIPANAGDLASQQRRNELQGKQADDELFGDGEGLTEKERMELTRLERDQGDRIKDSADRAKEMGPKKPDPSITSVAQQNTNNNVTHNTISASPNPRPTDSTINRTAVVNQN